MSRFLILACLALGACWRRQAVDDVSVLCLATPEGVPGRLVADVTQLGGDEAPEDGLCQLTDDGDGVVLHTSFWFGADMSPLSEDLPLTSSTATCEIDVDAAPIVVAFAGQDLEAAPDGAERCFTRRGGRFELDVPPEPDAD